MAKPDAYDFYCEEALSGKTALDVLYESDTVLAFHHTKPTFSTHIVIIPKEHIHDLLHLEKRHQKLWIEVLAVVQLLTKDLDIEEEGARLVTNMGAFQDTPHLHFHLISGQRLG